MTTPETNNSTKSAAAQASDTRPKHEYEFHPIADIFPLMEGEEFRVFVDDIKANGLQEPIVIYQGKILDGRNRYRAVIDAGHQYRLKDQDFKSYAGTRPLEFVVSANVRRRHLNTSQRALTAARLVTTKLGDNQYKGGITTEAAAKMLSVSEALVKTAKDVLDKASPEIQVKVQKGEVRLGAAKAVLDKPKEQQEQAVADAKAAAKARAQAAKANKEASKAKVTPSSTKRSDDIDELADILVRKLKEMKRKDPESAYAASANLVRMLEAADLMEQEEEEEEQEEAA